MRKLTDSEIFDLTNKNQGWVFVGNCLEKKILIYQFF